MPLPYRALWSYIRYTLYFIAYTPFHPPQQPRPTPVSRIYPLSFFPPPFAPVVCSFSGCMHAVPRGAGYYAVGVASTTLLPPSLSLSQSLCPYLPRASLFERRTRSNVPRAGGRWSMRACACRPRGKRETFFRGITFIALGFVLVREPRAAILSVN